ncbi:hypothetical protein ABZP36_024369 [Zizania latifolia]
MGGSIERLLSLLLGAVAGQWRAEEQEEDAAAASAEACRSQWSSGSGWTATAASERGQESPRSHERLVVRPAGRLGWSSGPTHASLFSLRVTIVPRACFSMSLGSLLNNDHRVYVCLSFSQHIFCKQMQHHVSPDEQV